MTNPFREAMSTLPGHWYQGDYTDGKGNYCAAGHVWKALGATDEKMMTGTDDTESEALWNLMNKTAANMFPERGDHMAFVNDHTATTEADILTVLDKAAVQFDEQQGLTFPAQSAKLDLRDL